MPALTVTEELQALERSLWDKIEAAPREHKAAFRTPGVSTMGLDRQPRSRTVVLREADAEAWSIGFHTDARSMKMAELAADPRAAILFWDPEAQLQVRLEGVADCYSTETVDGRNAFEVIPDAGRVQYRSRPAPETAIASADEVSFDSVDKREVDPALRNFVLVRVNVTRIDWLSLADRRQRRALLRRDEDGKTIRTWIAP